MKKIVFSLLAIGVMTFANATEGNVGKKEIDPTKKEAVSKKEQKAVSKEAAVKTNEDKQVWCSVWDGSGWVSYTYSCFFCWGGSHNGCIAEAVEYYGLGQ